MIEIEAMFKMEKLPKGKTRGWVMRINGKEHPATHIEIRSDFGTLIYGQRRDGYDGWVFREQGGGGAVTVPYAYTPNGELLIGLLSEKRANMGNKPVWCVIGGFINPRETHKQAHIREAAEEAGLNAMEAEELAGMATNPNRTFFVADAHAGEGVRAFGLRLSFEDLEEDDADRRERWKLKNAALLTSFLKANDVRFFHWRDAILISPDGLARAAIAQLLVAAL